MSMLSFLQEFLQRFYQIRVDESIDDFLITDRHLANRLCGRESSASEELLVVETGDGMAMSLYLAPELLRTVAETDPFRRLANGNMSAFCTVLEGVSHFLYLIVRARDARPVSHLEMELQAEVDKYAVLGYLLKVQRQGSLPAWLPRWLFEQVTYRADLMADELARYTTANAYARRYCRKIQTRFQWGWNGKDLLTELRRFYRLGLSQKMHHIDRGCRWG